MSRKQRIMLSVLVSLIVLSSVSSMALPEKARPEKKTSLDYKSLWFSPEAIKLPAEENELSRRYLRICEKWIPIGMSYFKDWPGRPNGGRGSPTEPEHGSGRGAGERGGKGSRRIFQGSGDAPAEETSDPALLLGRRRREKGVLLGGFLGPRRQGLACLEEGVFFRSLGNPAHGEFGDVPRHFGYPEGNAASKG